MHRTVIAALGLGLAAVAIVATAATASAPAASERQAAPGSLGVQVRFDLSSSEVACPAGLPQSATECRARTGNGFVRGLGSVSATYTLPLEVGPPNCPAAADPPYNLASFAKPLATTGRLSVAGEEEITFSLAEGARCVPVFGGHDYDPPEQEFTITGGTGPFAEASGKGMVERSVYGGVETEVWTGTLEVPGFEFDFTPPSLAFTSASATKLRHPGGSYVIQAALSLRDDVEGTPVAYRLRVKESPEHPRDRRLPELASQEGRNASGSVSTSLRVHPSSKRVRSVQLLLSGSDPFGNVVLLARSLKLPR